MKSILILCFSVAYSTLSAQITTNDFDENTGVNSYSGIGPGNWVDGSVGLGISENAGTEFIASANGNFTGTFYGLGISQVLGGVIENHDYRVSFFIGVYDSGGVPLEGIEFDDFVTLKLGGPNGNTVWDSVPTPTLYGEWLEWSGTYTPDLSDLGQPFTFECIFDLEGYHAIAIDGPFTMHDATLGLEAQEGNAKKELLKIVDLLGREVAPNTGELQIHVYTDGTTQKVMCVQ